MRFYATLSATAIIAATAVAALQAGASASTAMPVPGSSEPVHAGVVSGPANPGPSGPDLSDPTLSFTTTMISYTAVTVSPGGLAAGDGYVIAGQVTRHGDPDGLSTAQCTYTDVKGPVLRVCTVDYALDNGLIVTSGYINGPGKAAPVTLVVAGGTGAYAGARGYGLLQPTPAGSHVTLKLTG
jgi:hypothetical protein